MGDLSLLPITPVFTLSATGTNCAAILPVQATDGSSSISWTYTAQSISASPFVAQTDTTATGVFDLCVKFTNAATPVFAGQMEIVGPYSGNPTNDVLTYIIGGGDSVVNLVGSFSGSSSIILVPFVSNFHLTSNPCSSGTPASIPGISQPVVESTTTPGQYKLGTVSAAVDPSNYKFNICWKSSLSSTQFVPAGTIELRGPQILNTASFPALCISHQVCTVSITNNAASGIPTTAYAAVSRTTDCSPGGYYALAPAVATSTTTVTFSFTKIPYTAPNQVLAICWGPSDDPSITSLAKFPILIGFLQVQKPLCDPLTFFQVTDGNMETFRNSIKSGAIDPDCDLVYTLSTTSSVSSTVQQPVLRYAIHQRNELPTGYLEAILMSPLATINVNEKDGNGDTILKSMVSEGFTPHEIYETISALTIQPGSIGYVPAADDITLIVTEGLDEIFLRILMPRLSASQLLSQLVPIVSNGLLQSLSAILNRGINPIGTQAFHAAINAGNVVAFETLLAECCIISQCVDVVVDTNGKTARQLAADSNIADQLLTSIRDDTQTPKGCL